MKWGTFKYWNIFAWSKNYHGANRSFSLFLKTYGKTICLIWYQMTEFKTANVSRCHETELTLCSYCRWRLLTRGLRSTSCMNVSDKFHSQLVSWNCGPETWLQQTSLRPSSLFAAISSSANTQILLTQLSKSRETRPNPQVLAKKVCS